MSSIEKIKIYDCKREKKEYRKFFELHCKNSFLKSGVAYLISFDDLIEELKDENNLSIEIKIIRYNSLGKLKRATKKSFLNKVNYDTGEIN